MAPAYYESLKALVSARLELGVPVVPVYLAGLRALRPKGAREVRRGPATAEFLAPMAFAPVERRLLMPTAQLQTAMGAAHRVHAAGDEVVAGGGFVRAA